jgi:hypothetical protein
MSNDIAEAIKQASDGGPWDDEDAVRFIDSLEQFGVKVSLRGGSDTDDPKDAIDSGPEAAIEGLPPNLLIGFLAHRRDLACYLRGLRGEERAAAVADARSKARRVIMPLMRSLADHGVKGIKVQGVPIDELSDKDRGTSH